MRLTVRRPLVAAFAALFLAASPALAADLNFTLPNVSGRPGSLVDVPITVSPSPNGLGILAINFRLAFNPSVVFTSYSLADGFLQTWGTPFWNGTGSYLAAATAGASPITSTSTLLNTVRVRVHPAAVPGTHMPITFSVLQINEGSPTVAWTAGDLLVTAPPADVPASDPSRLSLAIASAIPARGPVQFAYALPDAGAASLAIYDVHGRVAWSSTLAGSPGEGTAQWDLRTSAGERVGPGVFFARLAFGERSVTRRMVVIE